MKRIRRMLTAFLAAATLFAGFLLPGASPAVFAEEGTVFDLTVQPGKDETELNFNWITRGQPADAYVEIAPVGASFDEGKTVFFGSSKRIGSYETVDGERVYRYENKATATGLTPGRSYLYRVGDGNTVSERHVVTLQERNSMRAYIVSDVHVIEMESWHKELPESVENWQITLSQMLDRDEAGLILSLGDQMQNTTRNDYLDGFFGVEGLADTLFAPINGNHDLSPASANLPSYVNVPNAVYPGSMGISDYYFKSGSVLFVMLSITDINFDEVDHGKTFEEAIKAYPDYDWLVVGFHEAIYGYYLKGYAASSGDALDYCNEQYEKFISLFDRYKPDLCLTGHSHSYARSYFIRNGEVLDTETDEDGAYLSPEGTLYVNMGTSSRMSEFGTQDPTPNWPWSFIEYSIHGHASYTYALLEAEGNDLRLEVRDNLSPDKVLDTVTVRKDLESKHAAQTEPVTEGQTAAETDAATDPAEKPETGGTGTAKILFFVTGGIALLLGAYTAVTFVKAKRKG